MGKQHHIIRKLILEIGLPTKEEALSVQNRLSEEYKRIILDIIEEILDRLVSELEVITIDKLEIDLGDISKAHLSEQIAQKVKTEMEDALAKLLYEVRNSPGGTSNVRVSTPGGGSVSVNVSRQQPERSELETLIYFLEYGVFPWSADKTVKPSLQEMIAVAMEKYPEQLRAAIVSNRLNKNIFTRLALQLPKSQLYYLAALLGCDFASKLPVIVDQLMKIIKQLNDTGYRMSRKKTLTVPDEPAMLEKVLLYFSGDEQHIPVLYTGSDEAQVKFIYRMLAELTGEIELKSAGRTPTLPGLKIIAPVKKAFSLFIAEKKKRNTEQLAEHKASKVISKEEIVRHALKTKKEELLPPDIEEGIYIGNAGMVILHPYLPAFFRHLKLVKDKEFVSEKAQHRAVHILQWLVYGDEKKEEATEHDLLLNKIFCGIDSTEPVPVEMKLTKKEKKEGTALLEAVVKNWPALRNTSVHGLRVTFLQKEGSLSNSGEDWELLIQRDSAVEFLIDRLPWAISMVKLPWSERVIYTQW